MSLLDKVIHELDDQYQGVPFHQNQHKDIKNNIGLLLNTKLDDCLSTRDLGMSSLAELGLNSSELCSAMAREIHRLIEKYERRVKVTYIGCDNHLSPWQLTFALRCILHNDSFQEINIEIVFRNNRYCEVF
ncbi:GPW/gp25 family protein [Helicobacter sp. MIT 05-5294]|uniref:GPW/gp25 family protein n=1 Tax=Helicobacter sp. MIT 05-5294 TaxID=1548150 RepID=UPI00051FD8BD|nr:GPW/gp25 family protein [Helicobacter sp. MIT 05-5294]TLD86755.1 type VI secretion system baseplate subunit TssE [Helicobacter sp. MIT 05-5294]